MANRTKKIEENLKKQKQREFNEFKNGCLNMLVQKNVLLVPRKGANDVLYEYVLINGNVKAYFIYDKGNVKFEEMQYPETPVAVIQDVIPDQG